MLYTKLEHNWTRTMQRARSSIHTWPRPSVGRYILNPIPASRYIARCFVELLHWKSASDPHLDGIFASSWVGLMGRSSHPSFNLVSHGDGEASPSLPSPANLLVCLASRLASPSHHTAGRPLAPSPTLLTACGRWWGWWGPGWGGRRGRGGEREDVLSAAIY